MLKFMFEFVAIFVGVAVMYSLANQMQRHIMSALDNFRTRDRVDYHTKQICARLAGMFLLATALGVFL